MAKSLENLEHLMYSSNSIPIMMILMSMKNRSVWFHFGFFFGDDFDALCSLYCQLSAHRLNNMMKNLEDTSKC